MKKSVKIPLIVLGSIIGVLLLLLLLVSPVAKSYIEKHDKELIGRELNIVKLRVNVISGTAKIDNLTLYEDDGSTRFLSFDRFENKIKILDLFHNRLWVKRVLLSGLKVNVEQNRTWFNFNSMIEHFGSGKPEEEQKPSDFGLIFNDIKIDKSSIHYADLAVGSEFDLRDISIRVPFVDMSDIKTDVGLDLSLADSATLHTELNLSENIEKYSVKLKINDLNIDIIEPYLQRMMAVDSLQGRLSLDLSAEGHTEHILDFDMTGGIALNGLSLSDTLGNNLGHIDSIWANIERFNLNQNLLSLNSLHLSGLTSAYIVQADSTTNFDLLLDHVNHHDTTVFENATDTLAWEINSVQERKPLSLDIAELKLSRINLVYHDYTLSDNFRYEVSDINITSEHFTLFGNNIVRLEALLNKVGRLNLLWQGNLNGLENHDLTLMMSNVKVADFSPYAQRLFGYSLENGTLSFQSQNKIVDGNIKGINKLQIASPAVGDKMKGYVPLYQKIPLKLGFYLLTDKRDNVSIDLPVSGNLNDPHFSYRKALLKVFGNLLVKVVSAPFRLFSDDNNMQYIPFDVLQSDFSAEEYTMIDNVASTLYAQPNLSIVLEAQVNYEETVKRLCNLQLQRDYYLFQHPDTDSTSIDFLTNEAIRSIKLNDKNLCQFVKQLSEKEDVHSEKEVSLVAHAVYHEKSEAIVNQLIDKRNEILSNYLQKAKGLSAEQVTVTNVEEGQLRTFQGASRFALHVMVHEEVSE